MQLMAEKWEKKYHDKGKEINKRLKDLEARETKAKGDESLIEEYRTLRAAMQANPQAWDVVNNLMNSQQPAVDPKYKELENKLNELEKDGKYRDVAMDLSKRFPDFDEDKIMEFASGFDFNDPHDLALYSYYANKGMKADDVKSEARADVVREMKKKKGLPTVGKKSPMPSEKPGSIDDWAEKMKARVRSGELKL